MDEQILDALRFYADLRNYAGQDPEVMRVQGSKAREALEIAEQPEWRSMESAPKDRTDVLLLAPNGRRDVGSYRIDRNGVGWWAVHCVQWEPTHWAPLPEVKEPQL